MKKQYLSILVITILVCAACSVAFAGEGHEHSGDKLKEFMTKPLTFWLVIVALVVSFVLGGLHALTPGHGKAVVAAYLVGTRGRIIDAVFLGLVVTFTHTFSVITIGVILLLTKDRFAQSDIVLWLSIVSGVLIIGIGAWLLVRNMRQYYSSKSDTHDDSHDHSHNHSHSHNHGHSHSHGHAHTHVPSERTGFWGLLTLGVSGGIVPCVDALIGLLFAISIDKLAWGVVILCAFSLGLAAVLVAIGILMVMAKPLLDRFTGEGIWLKRLPIISATVVIVLGALLVFKALLSAGIHI
ncbi:high frequency lysogenization protein HflD [Candidatus Poribacteria bacterium]|nr:high frequency lysogenization protein HflD [Candidatus Poribacteria bacterium]MYB64990.1 high frequency lysogenization protein HflD [Candidatus Poribacteria bacterium]MYF54499.1 high frequency lysogenization protein HflD [Candidatus Poribacteria bacterium]